MEKTNNIRTVAFFVMFTVFLILLLAILWPFYRPIAVAGMLAVLVAPVYRYLRFKLGSRSLAAAICTVLTVFVIVIPLTFLTIQLFSEVNESARTLSRLVHRDNISHSLGLMTQHPYFRRYFEVVERHVELFEADIFRSAYQLAEGSAKYLASNTFAIARNVFWFILEIFVVLISVFFMLKESDGILNNIKDLSPFKASETRQLLTKIKETVSASVFGSIMISLIQGVLGALGFYLLGLPSPVMWGVVMAIIGIVPVVGPSLIWLPAAAILLFSGEPIKAGLLIIWGGLLMGSVENVFRPMLVGQGSRLHPLLIFFSIFGAIILMGPIGFFMGPIILSLTMTTAEFLKERYND
jgi:predicted PurR-regulated permease PerM